MTINPNGDMSVTNRIIRDNTVELIPDDDNPSTGIASVDILYFLQAKDFDISKIKCLQNVGKGKFCLTLKDIPAKELFLENLKTFSVKNCNYTVESAGNIIWDYPVDSIPVAVFGLPFEMDNKYLVNKLTTYCELVKCDRSCFKPFPTVESGVRIVYVKKMFKPIPSHIYIKGIHVSIKYEGQTRGKICYNCGLHGHLGRECTKPDKRYSLPTNPNAPNPDDQMEFPALQPQTSPNSAIVSADIAAEPTHNINNIYEPNHEHLHINNHVLGNDPSEDNDPGVNNIIPSKNNTTKTNVYHSGQVEPANPGSLNQDLPTIDSIKTLVVNNDIPITTDTTDLILSSHAIDDVNKSIIDTSNGHVSSTPINTGSSVGQSYIEDNSIIDNLSHDIPETSQSNLNYDADVSLLNNSTVTKCDTVSKRERSFDSLSETEIDDKRARAESPLTETEV
ncbi:hypothetical protein SNE40_005184 [Patella caerulea]|uniref:CCHC-type domain-containing protein n=1 Tax=Patella caerulea TaxID=87958 RepID=A0AAN8KDU0_PATCE